MAISKLKMAETRSYFIKVDFLKNKTLYVKQKMHWLYLWFGGFIIGILCLITLGFVWLLCYRVRKKFIFEASPKKFIQKCWGYW
jgi:hypothetical protein